MTKKSAPLPQLSMAFVQPEIRIVYVFQSYEFFLSTSITDFGRPMKPFSLKFRIFGLGQTNCGDDFWGICGIFGQTVSAAILVQ